MEEWDGLLKPKGVEPSRMLCDETRWLNPPKPQQEKTRLLLTLVVARSLSRLNRKWGIREPRRMDDPRFYELLCLISDDVIPGELLPDIVRGDPSGLSAAADALSRCQNRMSPENPYTFLRKHQKSDNIGDIRDRIREIADAEPESAEISVPLSDDRNMTVLALGECGETLGERVSEIIPATGMSDRKFRETLIRLWLQGADIRWERLFPEGSFQKVPLPVYPFESVRHWVRRASEIRNSKLGTHIVRPEKLHPLLGQVLHPLLHENTSDLSEQRFTSTFTGEEFFLADHVVKGRHVLPGVAHLEMALAAVGRSAGNESGEIGIRLKNIVWARPLTVGEYPVSVHIALFPEENGEIAFKVEGESEEDGTPVVFSQGSADFIDITETPRLDIRSLRTACDREILESDRCYEIFTAQGLVYGPAHQAVEKVYAGTDQALAKLRLPSPVAGTLNEYTLHPSLADAALQACVGLMGDDHADPALPFALESLEIYGRCASSAWAYIRQDNSSKADTGIRKLDIDLCDDEGKVCARMSGFSSRVLKGEIRTATRTEPSDETLFLVPAWDTVRPERTEQPSPGVSDSVIIIGGTDDDRDSVRKQCPNTFILDIQSDGSVETIQKSIDACGTVDHILWISPRDACESVTDDALISDQNQGVIQVFGIIKALLGLNYGSRELDWTLITFQTQAMHGRDAVNPAQAGVHGLIGSAAKEYPNWKIRLIDWETGRDMLFSEIFTLPADSQGNALAYRDRQWWHQCLLSLRHPLPDTDQTMYRPGGVYVMIGGAGGIGEAWTEYMIRTYDAQIVWIGRSQKDAAIQAKIDRLADPGPAPHYISADATDMNALRNAYDEIRQKYQRVNGIIHAAIVLADKTLANMDEELFRAAFSAKADVSVCLAQVFGRESLDFVLFFSSMNTFLKAPGQSNYVAGCAFNDAYAQKLSREWPCAVKTMNWGYWGSVGIVASEAYRKRMAREGFGSVEPPEAMDALEKLLNGPLDRMALMKTTTPAAMKGLNPEESISVCPESLSPILQTIQSRVSADPEHGKTSATEDTGISLPDNLPEFLTRSASELLGVSSADIDPDSELTECGFDPVMLAQFANQITRECGPELTSTIFAEHPTLRSLAEHLTETYEDTVVRRSPPQNLLPAKHPHKQEMDTLLSDLLRGQLQSMGLIEERNASPADSRTKADFYDRWLEESMAVLVRNNRLRHNDGSYSVIDETPADMEALWREWDRKKQAWSDCPGMKAQTDLVEATMRALPHILAGKVPAVEIMFPDSSMKLVEGIYRDNPVSDFFNHTLADIAAAWVQERIRLDGTARIRILEIGAGPGATSAGVFEKIRPYQDHILEYCYTEITKSFLRHGEKEYGPDNPRLTYQIFDVEKFPAGQGIEVGGFDMVIAANVLHATKDIRQTLRNAKAALKTNGLLLLNEITAASLFNHLTFGLLEGWWLYEDTEVRIPGCPVLCSETWQRVLESEGFKSVIFPLKEAEELGQQVIVAESDGIVRRQEHGDDMPISDENGKRRQHQRLVPKNTQVAAAHVTTQMAENQVVLQQYLRQTVAEILGFDETDIDPQEGFFDMGMDSLAVIELRTHIQDDLGCQLKSDQMFNYPTVEKLAAYLTGQVPKSISEAPDQEIRNQKSEIRNLSLQDVPEHTETAEPSAPAVSAPEKSGLSEPIAIIGMACRFPGADSPGVFWELLREGRDAIIEIPPDRWDVDAFYDPDPDAPGKMYTRHGGFLPRATHFSAEFFGLSPGEAIRMDPQQRLLLEVTREALENAGIPPSQLMDSSTGVFVGIMNNNYMEQQLKGSPPGIVDDPYLNMGSSSSAASGRLSYFLGLQGPNIALDTACSSSLVGLHLACQSLERDECDLAIVGGVNVAVLPEPMINACKMGMLAKDGRCKTFDERADGFTVGEGCGMLVLKLLKDARMDNDTVLAVVRGTAVNEDGRSSNLIAPNGLAQQKVIRRALADADVRPHQIGYVEAHGTGTAMGDVVEVEAVRSVLEENRTEPFYMGAVKTNIGHLFAGAGVAGVIKTVLALQHKTVPPVVGPDTRNPEIEWNDTLMKLPSEAVPWQPIDGCWLAGISSFGWSGTNAHAIIERADPPLSEPSAQPWHILPLSAKTETALARACARLAAHLKSHSEEKLAEEELADMAHTLQTGRDAFSERRVVLCQTREQATEALENPDSELVLSGTQAVRQRSVTFMFPGTGDQYPGMGRQLYEHEPVFRENIDECLRILESLTGTDMREILYPPEEPDGDPAPEAESRLDFAQMLGRNAGASPQQEKLDRTVFAHPILFMTEFALAKLWMSRGIIPRNMIGYSLGEFVAACLAGVFSLEDALKLVAGRAKLIDELPTGSMLAVGAGEADILPHLDEGVSVAGINGPMMCVVAGGEAEIELMREKLQEQGLACRPLKTTHAFHSEKMAPVRAELANLLVSLSFSQPQIPCISNVTGDWITNEQANGPGYWLTHILNPVRFAQGIETVWQDNPDTILLEVGVGQTLGSLFMQHPLGHEIKDPLVLSSLPVSYDPQDDMALMLRSLGQLWLAGADPNWSSLYPGEKRRKVSMPTYPFEHTDYWQSDRSGSPVPCSSVSGKSEEIAVRESMDDWFYIPCWHQEPLPPFSPPPVQEWLIFTDEQGLGTEIAGQLEAAGQKTTTVMPGEDFRRVRDGVYTISTRTGKDYAALITHLYQSNQPPEQIMHLWNVSPSVPELIPESTREAQTEGFYSLIYLAQALGEQADLKAAHIWVVTADMQNVLGSETICPARSTVTGPCKIIPFEYPHLSCTSIDVSLNADNLSITARQLSSELLADIKPEIVAFRGCVRWSHSFRPFPLKQAGHGQTRLRKNGVYLITGGFGGLGYAVAEFLADSLQASLILTGRTELPERQDWESVLKDDTAAETVRNRIEKILALEKLGANVLAFSADVADLSQMQTVVGQSREQFGQIHGVFHTAGVPGAGLIQLKSPEAVEKVFAPKVWGTLVLDALFRDTDLEFMILYSSVTAITGGMGEVDYCAANAFLDAYSHHNRVRGRFPTFAINWGVWEWDAWQSDLMTVLPDVYQSVRTMREKHGLTFSQGNEVLSRVLCGNLAQVAVSPQNLSYLTTWWDRLKISDLADTVQETGTDHKKYPRPQLQTPYVPPVTEAEQAIVQVWAQALSLEKVGIHDRFFELGGNSLVGIRIVGQMRKIFDKNLSAAILYESPTVSALGRLLAPETEVETDEQTVNPHLERGRKRRKLQSKRPPRFKKTSEVQKDLRGF